VDTPAIVIDVPDHRAGRTGTHTDSLVKNQRAVPRARPRLFGEPDFDDEDSCDTCLAYRGRVRPYLGQCPECGAGQGA